MKVAITGSNSLLGVYFIKYFKKKKLKIFTLNKKKKFYLEKKIPFNFRGKKIDILIHLAHEYSSKSKEVNLVGTQKLFDNALKNNIKKIIFVSSLSSHRYAKSLYGKTKFKIEKYCLKTKKIIIVRPGLVFGYSLDKKLVLLKKIISFIPLIPYFEKNDKFLYSVSIDELIDHIFKIIKKKRDDYLIYNIFNKKKIYFIDLLNLYAPKKIKVKLPFFVFYYLGLSISKFIYLKSIDSFLGLLKNRNSYKNKSEKNLFTKKDIIYKR